MEKMTITILSVAQCDGHYRARARAVAQDATVTVEVRFTISSGISKAMLWKQAKDEVLRYLDPL